jgi:hypothetical protein
MFIFTEKDIITDVAGHDLFKTLPTGRERVDAREENRR